MSYARWNSDGSDVYVYGGPDGPTCHLCTLRKQDGETFVSSTWQGMIDHLEAHRAAGHTVPQYAINGLRADMERGECPHCYEVNCNCKE